MVAFGSNAVTYNPEKMVQLSPGTFLFQPANGVHYDQARDEEVTVQITGMGPVETSRLVVDYTARIYLILVSILIANG